MVYLDGLNVIAFKSETFSTTSTNTAQLGEEDDGNVYFHIAN